MLVAGLRAPEHSKPAKAKTAPACVSRNAAGGRPLERRRHQARSIWIGTGAGSAVHRHIRQRRRDHAQPADCPPLRQGRRARLAGAESGERALRGRRSHRQWHLRHELERRRRGRCWRRAFSPTSSSMCEPLGFVSIRNARWLPKTANGPRPRKSPKSKRSDAALPMHIPLVYKGPESTQPPPQPGTDQPPQ